MALTLAQFSPFGGGELLLGTADGRLRTYDSGTGRLRATMGENKEAGGASTSGLANGHLTERHTCLAWAQGGKKDKKKKGSSLLALAGTASGDVKAYNTQLGELVWRAPCCIEGGVTSLAVSSKDGLVYATGADCRICALDVQTGAVQSSFKGSKHPISCIALAPDAERIFGGSSSLALWDCSSQERTSKFTGHPTPVRAIAFAPDGSHAASAGTGERSLALWPTSPTPLPTTSPSTTPTPTSSSGKKSKRGGGLRAAVSSLPCPDPVVALDACPSGSSQNSSSDFHLAGVSEAGEAYVWHCTPAPSTSGRQAGEGAGLEGQLVALIRVNAGKGSSSSNQGEGQPSETILAVKLQSGTEGPVLLVARGSSARPAFESVPLSQQHLQQQRAGGPTGSPAVINLQAAAGGVLLGSMAKGLTAARGAGEQAADAKAGKLRHSRQDVTVLGPENQGAPMVVMGHVAAGQKRRAGDAADEAPVALGERGGEQEPVEDDEGFEEEEGVPLGERVAAMEARAEGRPLLDADGGGGGKEGDDAPSPSGSSKADSVAVLLTQALRSNDRVLLERCLATSNSRVIHNTVARIVPRDAALFLRAAVDRLLSRPARAAQLAPWLRALLHHHTGYLMAAPGAQAPLAALYQAIDGRVALYQQLLRLYGRLGLITAHSKKVGAADDAGTGLSGPEPEVVYEDASGDEDDEPEAEDPFALEGSGEGESDSEDGEGDSEEEGDEDDLMGDEDDDFDDE